MRITPINNQYNNKPSFGTMKIAKSVENQYLKEIIDNPEFARLANQLDEKGEDLIIEQDIIEHPYNPIIMLFSKPKRIFSISKFITQITELDNEKNILEYALRDFSVEKLARTMHINKDKSLQEKTPKKKNLIERFADLLLNG